MVEGEMNCREDYITDGSFEYYSYRRTADYVITAVRTIVYVVIEVIVKTVIGHPSVTGRQCLDTPAEVVGIRSIKAAQIAIREEIALTRRYALDIMVVDPVVVITVADIIMASAIAAIVIVRPLIVLSRYGRKAAAGDIGIGTDIGSRGLAVLVLGGVGHGVRCSGS